MNLYKVTNNNGGISFFKCASIIEAQEQSHKLVGNVFETHSIEFISETENYRQCIQKNILDICKFLDEIKNMCSLGDGSINNLLSELDTCSSNLISEEMLNVEILCQQLQGKIECIQKKIDTVQGICDH